MSFSEKLFPENKRDYRGKRWLKISLRTLHLIGVAGLGGAFFYPVDPSHWLPFLWLTVLSGIAMMAVEITSHGIWLLQLRGMAILLKIGLLIYSYWAPYPQTLWLAVTVLVISGVIAHAPGKVRYFSPFYWRVIQSDNWAWTRATRRAMGKEAER